MSERDPPICAAEVVFRVVRGRWALQLIKLIAEHESIHFLAMNRSLDGISRKVLSEQLRYFQQAGVIKRSQSSNRQEVFYELTDRGKQLKKAIDGLNDLADRWDSL